MATKTADSGKARMSAEERRAAGSGWLLRSSDDVRDFFAYGMLLNVVAAMDPPALGERWAQIAGPDPDKSPPRTDL